MGIFTQNLLDLYPHLLFPALKSCFGLSAWLKKQISDRSAHKTNIFSPRQTNTHNSSVVFVRVLRLLFTPVQLGSHRQLEQTEHGQLVRLCWISCALWPVGFWLLACAASVTSKVLLGLFYYTRQLHMHHLAPVGNINEVIYVFPSFQMAVRILCEFFPCVWGFCVCFYTHLYMCEVFDVFWVCCVGLLCVLRLVDGVAPEQMWHLNGLLFGKQVAECDRS